MLCALLAAWVGRRAFSLLDIAPGQLSTVRYEEISGKVVLAVDPWVRLREIPNLDLYDHRHELGVPAGFSVALNLTDGAGYTIENVSGRTAPRVVLGNRVSQAGPFDGEPGDPTTQRTVLVDLVSPRAGAAGALAVESWRPGARWQEEVGALDGMSGCLTPSAPPVMSVRRRGQTVHFRVGTCEGSTSVSGDQAQFAVLAGLDAVGVRRDSGAWAVGRRGTTDPRKVAALFVCAVLLVLGFTPGLAVVVLATLSLIAIWFPFESVVIGVALLPVALLAFPARRLPLKLFAGLLLLIALGGGLAVSAALANRVPRKVAIDPLPKGEPFQCLAVGYSTVADFGLRPGVSGIFEDLNTSCRPCLGRTGRVARAGEAFDYVRAAMCGPSFPSDDHPEVLFNGGTNDDIWWGIISGPPLERFLTGLGVARFFFNDRRVDRAERFTDPELWKMAGYNQALKTLPEQLQAITDALGCVRRAGSPFWFFHDFLVYDLQRGRVEQRRQLVAARRETTLRAGGQFVDLLEATQGEAGPSWFNDPIHLSSIGHRRIAALMCRTIEQAGPR